MMAWWKAAVVHRWCYQLSELELFEVINGQLRRFTVPSFEHEFGLGMANPSLVSGFLWAVYVPTMTNQWGTLVQNRWLIENWILGLRSPQLCHGSRCCKLKLGPGLHVLKFLNTVRMVTYHICRWPEANPSRYPYSSPISIMIGHNYSNIIP